MRGSVKLMDKNGDPEKAMTNYSRMSGASPLCRFFPDTGDHRFAQISNSSFNLTVGDCLANNSKLINS